MHRMETVEESHSRGQVREIYRDIEHSLGVPFVGAIFRAFAAVPEVLPSIWSQIRPNLGTQAFAYLSRRLRRQSEALAESTFELVDLYGWMIDHNCSREDIRRVLYSLEMLHFVDPKLLLITASLFANLHGIHDERIERRKPSIPTSQEPEFPTAIHRVMYEQAPEIVKEAYLDILDTCKSPIVPDDAQIIGNWPQFLHKAWTELKPMLHSPTFIEESRSLAGLAISLAQELPYPIDISNVDRNVHDIVNKFLRIYSGTTVTTAAVRWMMIEGQRSSRNAGRAAGEPSE